MTEFTKRVINIIKSIPEGKVMTYGQIAGLAGSPRAARQVVRILHSSSKKYQLPWHRVLNKEGKIVLKDEEAIFTQRMLLIEEGVTFLSENAVDLSTNQYCLILEEECH